MVKPEVSIVMPVYNVAEWLNMCLGSIQHQTFTAWECILVDDGSTDLSGRICDGFGKQDERFHVIHQENAGVSAARNVGIEVATAPLLAFIDPDDFISADYFELLVSELWRVGADVAVSNWFYLNENGKEGNYWLANRLNQLSSCEIMGRDAIIDAVSNNFFHVQAGGKYIDGNCGEQPAFLLALILEKI